MITAQQKYQRRERAKRKIKLLAYLVDHPCVDCGEDDLMVLEFDHVRGEKEKAVSRLVNDCVSWEKILEEVEKCDVRCANCHKRKTAKQLGFWKQLNS